MNRRRLPSSLWTLLIASTTCLITISNHSAIAEETVAVSETTPSAPELDAIRKQVDEESEALQKIIESQALVQAELKAANKNLEDIRAQAQKIAAELKEIQRQRSIAAEKVRVVGMQIEQLEAESVARLRAVYMHGAELSKAGILLASLKSGDSWSPARFSGYLNRVREGDRATVLKLSELRQVSIKRGEELAAITENRDLVSLRLKAKEAEALAALSSKEAVVAKLKIEREDREQVLVRLKAQALRLEMVVSSLTGSTKAETPPSIQDGGQPPSDSQGSQEPIHYQGPGLFRLKGSLKLPVKGKVVRGFGKYKADGFAEMMQSKGIAFSSAPNADVRAIGEGAVIFVGAMPGLQTVVIIDHGERYYSLYGLLSEAKVSRGRIVSAGDVIGKTLGEPEGGRSFYFETRQNGQPVNPQSYYKKRF